MLATYWHSYSYVMNPRKLDEAEAIYHGVFQVMVCWRHICKATHDYCLRNWHLSIVNNVRTKDPQPGRMTNDEVTLGLQRWRLRTSGLVCITLRPSDQRERRPSSFVLSEENKMATKKAGWAAFPHDNSAFGSRRRSAQENWARLLGRRRAVPDRQGR